MRYASIRECDVSNGENIGVSLFVQGCHRHCYNCFNPETWDFNSGKEWTKEVKNKFFTLIDRPYIKRISLLGGEPLADENLEDILDLVTTIKEKFPTKMIWLYTGYTLKYILNEKDNCSTKRQTIISKCDVIVDGEYIDSQRDITLAWRGSRNQHIWKKENNIWINITKEVDEKNE